MGNFCGCFLPPTLDSSSASQKLVNLSCLLKRMGNFCGCFQTPPPNNQSPAAPLSHSSSPIHPPPDSAIQSINESAPTSQTHLSFPRLSLVSIIRSIRQSIGNEIRPIQIDLLVKFVDSTLHRMKALSVKEASTSPSAVPLESVAWSTRAASDIIDSIVAEANQSKNLEEARGLFIKTVEEMGESHWIFLGLSMAAYAMERCAGGSECDELLEKMGHLAKHVKNLGEVTPHDSERLSRAVQVIVEGTSLCIYSSTLRNSSWYWFCRVMNDLIEKTEKSIQDITSSRLPSLTAVVDNISTVTDIERQVSVRNIEHSTQNLVDFKPEGIEEKVSKVKEMVDLEGSEAAVAVVLWGFGGVGKSVLASTVVEELDCISKGFKFCRVTIDEKIPYRTSYIKRLQQDIIYHFGGGELELRTTVEGRQQVQNVLRNKRCFIFIDNVVDAWYIRELLPRKLQVAKEVRLRIVITSRQNNIKHWLGIKVLKEYHVEPLCDAAAKIILRRTILGEGDEDERQIVKGDLDEESCIDAIAEACKGVPLLLSIFGDYLRFEREHSTYEKVLKALKDGDIDRFDDEGNLSEKLLFQYDKMRDREAKEAFLDICTYFHGWSWDDVAAIVDSDNLETLHKQGLVKRDESGNVFVTDILRLMGNKVANETRITNYREFSNVVGDKHKLNNIKGLSLLEDTCLTKVESIHLDAMSSSLRVLMLGDSVVINDQCDGAFTNLRYLQVGDMAGFPFTDASKMERLKYFYNKSTTGMGLPQIPKSLMTMQYDVLYAGCNDFATLQLGNQKDASFLHL